MPNTHSHRLILAPVDSQFSIANLTSLINILSERGFIGHTIENDTCNCFDTGEHYLDYVSYLGCSPTLYDGNDEPLTFISVVNSDQRLFNFSSKIPPPRCPACQAAVKNIDELIRITINGASDSVYCKQCQQKLNLFDLGWRKNGGVARTLLQIHGIQEHLAVPSESLLQLLESESGVRWHYYFAASSAIQESE